MKVTHSTKGRAKISSFCIPNLRNNPLLRAVRALYPKGITNLNILGHNSLRPELIRGSLVTSLHVG